MGVSEIRAGRAYVEISAKDRLDRTLNQAKAKLAAFSAGAAKMGVGFLAFGGLVKGALGAAVHELTTIADELVNASDRTGIAVQSLSELKLAAEDAGASLDSLVKASRGMGQFMLAAQDPKSDAAARLKALGLSLGQLAALSPEQRFLELADAVARVRDPTLRAATATEVFGKSAIDLLPLLMTGRRGIEALRAHARQLGVTMTDETARAADDLGDSIHDLATQGKFLAATAAGFLAPALQQLVTVTQGVAAATINWLGVSGGQGVTLLSGLATGALVLGSALLGLSLAARAAAFAIGGLQTALAAAQAAFGIASAAISFLIAHAAALGIGLAAVAAIVGGLMAVNFLSGGALVRAFGGAFAWAKELAVSSLAGIRDALAAGDIGLAASIAWLSIREGALGAWTAIREGWIGFKVWFFGFWNDISSGVQAVWNMLAGAFSWFVLELSRIAQPLLELFGAGFDVDVAIDALDRQMRHKMAQLGQAQRDQETANRAAFAAQRREATASLRALHAERQRALAEAAAKANEAREAREQAREARLEVAANAHQQAAGEFAAGPAAGPGFTSAGGFNPNAVFGLGGSAETALQSTARSVRDQLGVLEEIRDLLGLNRGPTFAA